MKIKRFIASSLILIIVTSSMGFYCNGFSQDLTTYKDAQSATATQLVADTQDPSHEFREGFKTNHTTQVNTISVSFIFAASQCTFEAIRYSQYEAYLRKQLFQRPSSKLFLDFRSLII
mgnify:CR=1 FL=1